MELSPSIYLLAMLISTFISSSQCDLTPFQKDIEKFLPAQSLLMDNLKKYLIAEEERIQRIKEIAGRHEKIVHVMQQNKLKFLANPLHVYLFVKSLTLDLTALSDLVLTNVTEDVFLSSLNSEEFPNSEDLLSASNSLAWMQATSNIEKFNEKYYESTDLPAVQLSADECFEIGMMAYKIYDFEGTAYWMKKAFLKYNQSGACDADGSAISCLEFMAYAYAMEGNFNKSVNINQHILWTEPNNTRAQENLKELQSAIAKGETKFDIPKDTLIDYNGFIEDLRGYATLCRGESNKSPLEESKLFCRYLRNRPYLMLQPVKEEELNLNPRVLLYHDVISDNEINVIKELAMPKLYTADVPADIKVDIRISKCAWLNEEDHKVVSRFSQRIEDITGLSIETSESFQVANYGIGGFYRLHPDFFAETKPDKPNGDRMATWLSYLHAVDEGGFTVFPSIDTIVKPEKGSAVFWYNLYRNGTGNYNTVHAACPVLAGSKWIVTKWFYEAGQMFLKPCTLVQNQ